MRTPANSQPTEPSALGLLPLDAAMRMTGMSRTAFWRWRRRHGVKMVCGRQVHIEDMNSAIARERGVKVSVNPTKK